MKTDQSNDVAEFRPMPLREAVWRASLIIVDRQPAAALDSAVLLMAPIPQKPNRSVRSRQASTSLYSSAAIPCRCVSIQR
jgi:hypothetical protein